MPADKLQAGDMTERLRIEREDQIALPGGVRQPSWVLLAEIWAKVVPLTGGEAIAGDQVEGQMRYRIWLRNRRDLDTSMRLIWVTAGNQVLNIRELPDPGVRPLFRQLVAHSGVAS